MSALPPRSEWRVRRPRQAPVPSAFRAEEGTETFVVRVVIEQDGFLTGWDEGALGLEPDAVWFSGECTSFRLVAKDFVILPSPYRVDLEDARRCGLILHHPSRTIRVRLLPLSGSVAELGRILGALSVIHQRLRRPDIGGSQYPPLVPRPGARVWRPKTEMLALPGTPGPLASFLERTGLLTLLASDLNVWGERTQRARLLREIAREEKAVP